MAAARAHGRDITKDNLTYAAVTFSIRRAVQEVIAQQKLLWVRDKDIFTRPPKSLLTHEFIADCIIYSLFDRQSNQTSLRNYEYNGNTYRVVNGFFPLSQDAIQQLAQCEKMRDIEIDMMPDKGSERFVYTWLEHHRSDLSTEARELLDTAWSIIDESFHQRRSYDVINPRFQVLSWDAGWAQVNAMVFGKNRYDDELYDKYYETFRATRRALGNKIATAAMDAGVI